MQFYVVYIREAHPIDGLSPLGGNGAKNLCANFSNWVNIYNSTYNPNRKRNFQGSN